MPDLLLELFSEEIPARMQAAGAKDLERLTVGALTDRGYLFEGIKAFAGPRRLTLAITGLPPEQKDVREELKGPKVDAPQAALDGFLKKTGLIKDQLKVETTPKGDVYVAVIERKGRPTPAVLAEILPEIFARFPWPKSMRWRAGDPVRWVRPLHSILCTFDGEVVPFTFAGIQSGNTTQGHRFLSSGAITVRRFEDYEAALKQAHVVLDAAERAEIIAHDLKQKAFALGLEPIEDAGLLAEVSGLAEWPTVLIGTIQDQFMDVPAEILQTSMRTHQKYFSLRDPKTGKMANRFALVSNMVASDGGKEIVGGNERVLRARLSDAKFFWDEDRKKTLESRVERLKDIVFHAKLGTQYDRAIRTVALAGVIAAQIGTEVDVAKARRAGRFAKADLTTGVVGEFPELQGVMGRYYALNDGEDVSVADAIRDHYRPLGPNDLVPSAPASVAVALADKLDTLVGFFAAGEKPTGSGDPFALRRAALGIIRLILDNSVRIDLARLAEITLPGIVKAHNPLWLSNIENLLENPLSTTFIEITDDLSAFFNSTVWGRIFEEQVRPENFKAAVRAGEIALNYGDARFGDFLESIRQFHRQYSDVIWLHYSNEEERRENLDAVRDGDAAAVKIFSKVLQDVRLFIADRLKVALKEKGVRHDLIDAVFSLGGEDDLVRLVARVEALQTFLKTEDGANLLAGYKRAANILKAEEKKDGKTFTGEVRESHLADAADTSLFVALGRARAAIGPALEREDFAAAMQQMAALRVPVDGFFEAVKVNADDKAVRENRLNLLASLRAALHRVADFSRIEG